MSVARCRSNLRSSRHGGPPNCYSNEFRDLLVLPALPEGSTKWLYQSSALLIHLGLLSLRVLPAPVTERRRVENRSHERNERSHTALDGPQGVRGFLVRAGPLTTARKFLSFFGGPADPYFLQVSREPDYAVMNICPSWITQRLPRGPEPEPQDLSRRR